MVRVYGLGAALMMVIVVGGCAPITSTVEIKRAAVALDAAENAGAKRYAVYEYHAAKLYLDKAREEDAYAEFWASQRYAEKASNFAKKARTLAQDRARRGEESTLPTRAVLPDSTDEHSTDKQGDEQ